MRATGNIHATVLFVDFPNGAATRSPEQVFATFATATVDSFRAGSYGSASVVFEPVFRWVRMSKAASEYGFDAPRLPTQTHQAYIQEAINLAGAGIDYSRTDSVVVIANPDSALPVPAFGLVAPVGSGVTAGGRLIQNGLTTGGTALFPPQTVAHELGHNLGLPDLYHGDGARDRSAGVYGIMANGRSTVGEFLAWERWVVGWIDDSQVACVPSGTATVTLSPVARSGGTKMVVVPLSSTQAVVAESRRNEGRDSGLTPGVLVYLVDSAVASLQGPIKVLPVDDSDLTKLTKPLAAGRSLTFNGVTVTVVSSDGSGDVVTVSR